MQLNLKNPLVFFDLETTGINIVKDRIVEISFVKVYPNGKEESKTRRINPEMPIPPESTAIHGIIHFKSGCKGTTSFANEQTTYILTKSQARQSSFFLFEVITDSAYLVNET